jgi:hypothetical protein
LGHLWIFRLETLTRPIHTQFVSNKSSICLFLQTLLTFFKWFDLD